MRAEVEITYSILVNGVEVGFGSSGGSLSIDEALRLVETAISRREWESVQAITTSAQSGHESDDNGSTGEAS